MLAIGEFSRLTHLGVRTLRRYHDADLLVPATVDESTGYRYYGADQIQTAQVDWTTHPFLAQKDHPRAS